MDLEANLQSYLDGNNTNPDGRDPAERNASFDYCFNHFQSYRESRRVRELASPANVQHSCLHLGFYLASWGMLRNSKLMGKSAKYLVPVVEVIATADASLWEIDADCYTATNIHRLLEIAGKICNALPGVSGTDTLKTKIMLGVFGSVPAFDRTFRRGCREERMVATFGKRALKKIAEFYQEHDKVIDAYRVRTLDFSGGHTQRCYTRAKVIDMALSTEGEKLEQADELAKLAERAAAQNKLLAV
ncbi:MAG: hypothetical protein WBX03_12260 [Terriglobales bacterium]|jgi:hypothetical protein